jgi:hypothetical protein
MNQHLKKRSAKTLEPKGKPASLKSRRLPLRTVKKEKRPLKKGLKSTITRKPHLNISIINERKNMPDQEFQAGLPAAMQAAFEAYVASTGFAATLVAGASTISYVPAPTSTPPTEVVTF